MHYAPIALFVYKRLWHTQRTMESLLRNNLAQYSDLYIFSDGAKNINNEAEVAQVREWIDNISGFKTVHIVRREKNLGLAQSIIQGVDTILNQFENIIVLEDDFILSPHFLTYMNEGLAMYYDDEAVASIHGYSLPSKGSKPETYFLRGADCWGWATWKRAWKKFEPDGAKLLALLTQQNLLHEFDFMGTQPYVKMLKDQILGKNDSWAIRWHASAFLNNLFTLYPGKSLVQNIGLDNSGEHCSETTLMNVQIADQPIVLQRISIEENKTVFNSYVKYFKASRESLYRKIFRKIKTMYEYSMERLCLRNIIKK